MRHRLIILLIFLSALGSNTEAQWITRDNYPAINIPDSSTVTTTGIAAYINKNFKSEKDKVWAIYDWVTDNIRYSTDSVNIINLGVDPDAKITYALRRRKGVCENYAAIYNDIALKCGIRSYVIDGYTKQAGTVDRVGHNWCAVQIDKEWYLTDPTWGSSSGVKSRYFFGSP